MALALVKHGSVCYSSALFWDVGSNVRPHSCEGNRFAAARFCRLQGFILIDLFCFFVSSCKESADGQDCGKTAFTVTNPAWSNLCSSLKGSDSAGINLASMWARKDRCSRDERLQKCAPEGEDGLVTKTQAGVGITELDLVWPQTSCVNLNKSLMSKFASVGQESWMPTKWLSFQARCWAPAASVGFSRRLLVFGPNRGASSLQL